MFCVTRAASLRGLLLAAAVLSVGLMALASPALAAAPLYRAATDTATLTPVDTATATPVFGSNVDDDTTDFTAPFAVALYGNAYDALTISSNGYVGMGTGTASYLSSSDDDDFGTPIVSAFNADVYTADTGGVWAETRGSAPNRQLVIEWHVNECCSGDPVSSRFQVIFAEGSTAVEARYTGTIGYDGWIGVKHDPSQFTRATADEQASFPAADTRITYTSVSVSTAALSDDTPTFTGNAGDPTTNVSVNIYAGTDTTVAPLRTLSSAPGAGGDYSVTLPDADRLPAGGYTVQATQTDGAVTTRSTSQAFSVDRTAPDVKLLAPANGAQTAEATPVFAGTGGTAAGDGSEIKVFIYAGGTPAGDPVQTLTTTLAGDGTFTVRPTTALASGQYTALATQADAAGNAATSAAVTFTVLASKRPACRSRRVFDKHLSRPGGTGLRVVATLNGKKIKSKLRRHQIVIPVDLRGKPKGAYTLRVRISRTLKSGRHKTVQRFVYRTCV
jgi:hypothetical protein